MADLDTLNTYLQAEDDRLTAHFTETAMPVCFIMEMGRSGSTVLIQALANSLRQGYVGRVLAKHWLAPYMGALMEQEILKPEDVAGFDFSYGKTMGPHEPNEWGWFWRYWLGLEKGETYRTPASPPMDGAGLNRKLAAIEAAKAAPLLFDNVYARANMPELRRIIPKILLIHLLRDPYYVCNSHINARISHAGGLESFYGHEPANMDELIKIADPVEQVVAQMKSVSDELDATLTLFDVGMVHRVKYADTVTDIRLVMEDYMGFLEAHGVTVERKPPIKARQLLNRDTPDVVRPEFKERLDHYYREYFGEEPPCPS